MDKQSKDVMTTIEDVPPNREGNDHENNNKSDPYADDPGIIAMRERSKLLYDAIRETREVCQNVIESIKERNGGIIPPLMYKGKPIYSISDLEPLK